MLSVILLPFLDSKSCFYFRSSSAKSLESVGIVGTAEKSFLSQTNAVEEESIVPTLDEFGSEIDIYKVCVRS